jgi:hypothetical protein
MIQTIEPSPERTDILLGRIDPDYGINGYYMQVRFRLERFEDQRVMHGMYSATHGQYDIPSTIFARTITASVEVTSTPR